MAARMGHGVSGKVFTMATQTPAAAPPVFRGYLHLANALVAPFALLLLLYIADSPREVVGGAVFGASLMILYSTSATFHLFPLGRRLRGLMKRLDHSTIFVFIAGAYTPFALNLKSTAWGIPVLSVVGGLAVVGIITSLAAPAAPRWIRVGLYFAVGWVGIVAISELVTTLPGEAFAMLVLKWGLIFRRGSDICHQVAEPLPKCFRVPRDVSRTASCRHHPDLLGLWPFTSCDHSGQWFRPTCPWCKVSVPMGISPSHAPTPLFLVAIAVAIGTTANLLLIHFVLIGLAPKPVLFTIETGAAPAFTVSSNTKLISSRFDLYSLRKCTNYVAQAPLSGIGWASRQVATC